jgi:hypothetical protein
MPPISSKDFAKGFLKSMRIKLEEEDQKFLQLIDRHGAKGFIWRKARNVLLSMSAFIVLYVPAHYLYNNKIRHFAQNGIQSFTFVLLVAGLLISIACMGWEMRALVNVRGILKTTKPAGTRPKK